MEIDDKRQSSDAGKINESLIKIEDIVEKPLYDEAPSDIAVCGRYIFNASIFKFLKSTNFDKSGEIQLTDAIKYLIVLSRRILRGVRSIAVGSLDEQLVESMLLSVSSWYKELTR